MCDENGNAYINDARIGDTKLLNQVAVHEAVHEMIAQDVANGGQQYSDTENETYADHFGSNIGDYLDVGLGINGYGDLASSNNHVGNTEFGVIQNNSEYDGLDKSQGDNFLALFVNAGEAAALATTSAGATGHNTTVTTGMVYSSIDSVTNFFSGIGDSLGQLFAVETKYTEQEIDQLANQYNEILALKNSGYTAEERLKMDSILQQMPDKVAARAEELRNDSSTIDDPIDPSTSLPVQDSLDPTSVTESAEPIDPSTETTATNEQGLGTTESPSDSGVDPLIIVNSEDGGKSDGSSDSDSDKVSDNSDIKKVVTTQFEKKIEKQMGKRGWDKDSVNSTIDNPQKIVSTRDTRWNSDGTRRDEPATAYIREDGHYVVRNDNDGTIVQISNLNKADWKSPFE